MIRQVFLTWIDEVHMNRRTEGGLVDEHTSHPSMLEPTFLQGCG